MSTSAMIARKDDSGFTGRYHHSDGYPEGLGKALWDRLAPTAHDTLEAQIAGRVTLRERLEQLIDKHPGGWSNILGVDWTLAPGFGPGDQPKCYCHGTRNETADVWTEADKGNVSYSYIINPDEQAMAIWKADRLLALVDLTGPEPDWAALGRKAAAL